MLEPVREQRHRFELFLLVLLTLIVGGGVVDVVLDRPQSWTSTHVLIEVGLILLSLGSAVYLGLGWYRTGARLDRVHDALEQHREAQRIWEQRAREWTEGLRAAVEQQLSAWNLTRAERETAMMLLRGHSHKQIAALAGKSERTVRQHAVAVYRKSGLGGRAELAAFFLEGVFGSSTTSAGPPPPVGD